MKTEFVNAGVPETFYTFYTSDGAIWYVSIEHHEGADRWVVARNGRVVENQVYAKYTPVPTTLAKPFNYTERYVAVDGAVWDIRTRPSVVKPHMDFWEVRRNGRSAMFQRQPRFVPTPKAKTPRVLKVGDVVQNYRGQIGMVTHISGVLCDVQFQGVEEGPRWCGYKILDLVHGYFHITERVTP